MDPAHGLPGSALHRADVAGDSARRLAPALVVLDLDGTVCMLDVPWEDVKRELVALATAHGIPTCGHRRVLSLLAAARAADAGAFAAMEAALARAEVDGADRCLVNEDLVEWVERLPEATPVSVLTLNAAAAARRALGRAGLDGRVSSIIGRGDAPPKPDPSGLRTLLSRHAAEAKHALLVGDSPGDAECALRAGVPFLDVRLIGRAWGAQLTAAA